jgi:rare lipoprotein A
MVVRLSAVLCVVAVMFVCSSSTVVKSNVAMQAAAGTAAIGRQQNKLDAAVSGVTILGTASTYNPYRPGYRSGGAETASGETYDPDGWTAAIQIDLREMFGGVRYGKDYRPSYALVAKANRQVIVKINDVGPLERGRVIDFNEQTMRYFDPSLELGLIYPIEVKPLLGDDWSPGPIANNN